MNERRIFTDSKGLIKREVSKYTKSILPTEEDILLCWAGIVKAIEDIFSFVLFHTEWKIRKIPIIIGSSLYTENNILNLHFIKKYKNFYRATRNQKYLILQKVGNTYAYYVYNVKVVEDKDEVYSRFVIAVDILSEKVVVELHDGKEELHILYEFKV